MNRAAAASIAAVAISLVSASAAAESAPVWAEDATVTPCAYSLGVGGERVTPFEDGSAVDTCWGAVYSFDPDSNEWDWMPEAGPRLQVAAALSNLGLREYIP